MDWIKNFNRAMDYIEDNITESLDNSLIAKEAYSSKFHFLRVFNILTGKTLGEYIRDRRLSLAAQDIISGDDKIINIALKYKYENAGAFTKAFKRFHGITPSQAKNSAEILKAAPPIKFYIDVKGEEKMDYKIEKKNPFKVVGVSREISNKDGENFKQIPKFWQDKSSDGTMEEIVPLITQKGLMGICCDFDMENDTFDYMIAVEGDKEKGKLNKLFQIPELTWAIFPGKGKMPDAIQEVWKKIFHEWFPATNYIHAKGPEIEIYLGDDNPEKETVFEVWVPVEVKE